MITKATQPPAPEFAKRNERLIAPQLGDERLPQDQADQQLDAILEKIRNGSVDDGMADLFRCLRSWRGSSSNVDWDDFVSNHCLAHPVADVIYQDPMTLHSHRRPRGYPGDAELLDYIYRIKGCSDLESVTPVGSEIHDFLLRAAAARAVRVRRGILASFIDRVATKVRNPRVLSIAAGHVREAELSSTVQRGLVKEFIALDQDDRSLNRVDQDYGHLGVEVVQGSVRDLLSGKREFRDFDVVYAAGLYDYLQQKTAQRLTRFMFDALRSRGRMLVANFLPDISDIGFMEAFMGWKLIYRSRTQLLDVSSEIAFDELEDICLYGEPNRHILFLEIEKR